MSTLKVSTIKSLTASTPPAFQDTNGVEVGQLCRAWVNFNGTGTVALRDSFNVSSITDNATGDYTINYTVAMPTVNYSFASSTRRSDGAALDPNGAVLARGAGTYSAAITTTFLRVSVGAPSTATNSDYDYIGIMVFGD
jgi:hypothetical protein